VTVSLISSYIRCFQYMQKCCAICWVSITQSSRTVVTSNCLGYWLAHLSIVKTPLSSNSSFSCATHHLVLSCLHCANMLTVLIAGVLKRMVHISAFWFSKVQHDPQGRKHCYFVLAGKMYSFIQICSGDMGSFAPWLAPQTM
jgi:hypothetical protein